MSTDNSLEDLGVSVDTDNLSEEQVSKCFDMFFVTGPIYVPKVLQI